MSDLKRLAEAAVEGQTYEWFAAVPKGAAVNPTGSALLNGPRRRDLDRMVAYVREDAEFIAAAHPGAVLALIAENERVRELLVELLDNSTQFISAIEAEPGIDLEDWAEKARAAISMAQTEVKQ